MQPFTPYMGYCLMTTYRNSSPQKADRAYSGGAPQHRPLSKSYSVDTTSSTVTATSLPGGIPVAPPVAAPTSIFIRGKSQRASVSSQHPRKLQPRNSEDVVKRSRSQTAYELSQDLLDKQIEMLERKYGGHVRASKAALTIQRAFRRYTMVKRFADITSMAKTEKRLSRRFNTMDLSNGNVISEEWNKAEKDENYDYQGESETAIKKNFQTLYQELKFDPAVRPLSRPIRSLSLRERKGRPVVYNRNKSIELEPIKPSWFHGPREQNGNIGHVGGSGIPPYSLQRAQSVTSTPRGLYHQEHVTDYLEQDMYSSGYSGYTNADNSLYYTPPTVSPYLAQQRMGFTDTQRGRSYPVMGGDNYSISDSLYYTSRDSFSEDSGVHSVGYESQLREPVFRHSVSSTPVYPNSFGRLRRDMMPHHSLLTPQRSVDKKIPPEVPKRTSSISSNISFGGGEVRKQLSLDSTCSAGSVFLRSETESKGSSDSQSVSSGNTIGDQSISSSGTGFSVSGTSVMMVEPGKYPTVIVKNSGLPADVENGSLSSVQSSGSDSSLSVSTDRGTPCDVMDGDPFRSGASPVWKRKGMILQSSTDTLLGLKPEDKRLSNISEYSEESTEGTGYSSNSSFPSTETIQRLSGVSYELSLGSKSDFSQDMAKLPEIIRKRQYRVGLNLFNKKPEKGISFLIANNFLDNSPQAVARFLISRKGLSKQMIGEYLGNLQNPFSMLTLECFAQELDLAGMQVDVALRKFQTYFRMPGEAQKIERLMEVFGQHFCGCNRDIVAKFHNHDTVFILAFAIIMLNTDLHTPNLKPERRMKLDDFVKNLRGIDDGADIDRDMLVGIYERVKAQDFKPGSDHVTQVMKVQQTIVGKKPNLAIPHRRLVCYCRLYEVPDVNKKERPGLHQREVFLFNDLMVITKIFNKKKNSVTYSFRQSIPLYGLNVTLYEVPNYLHGIRLSQRVDGKVLVNFNARNEHDRSKFVEDLRESVFEMDEMENLRIEGELEKQKSVRLRSSENRDSGVADMELIAPKDGVDAKSNLEVLKGSTLSNSLLDIHDQQSEKLHRRGSFGSLDSGMSVSFQSSSTSNISRDSSPQNVQSVSSSKATKPASQQHSFLGGLFHRKERKHAQSDSSSSQSRSTDV